MEGELQEREEDRISKSFSRIFFNFCITAAAAAICVSKIDFFAMLEFV